MTLCVTDSTSTQVCLGTQAQPFQITVNPAANVLAITTQSPLPYASVGVNYVEAIAASGGTSPYTFVLAPGSALPGGLTLSANGQISGSPASAGTDTFTVNVTDSSNLQQHASRTFTVTVNTTSTGCPANPGNSLCGLYWFAVRGFNATGGPTALGGAFTVDSAGNFSGEVVANDSVSGFTRTVVTGGTFAMDPSGDGRGVVTLNSAGGAIASLRFVLRGTFSNPIMEFETSGARLGTRAQGSIIGPETAPVPAMAGNTDLAVDLVGADGGGHKSAMLGLFTIGANGCDGSPGSFKSLESFLTNTAGTVHTGLTAAFARRNSFFGLSFGGLGPCVFAQQGSVDGTVNSHTAIASITRFTPTSGTSGTGTVSGVIDQNAAGALTNQSPWGYTNYSVDANGVGTLSGAGQKDLHVVLGSNGFLTLDESAEVRTGRFIQQNTTALAAGGVLGNALGASANAGPGDLIGVATASGSTAGNFIGTVDYVSTHASFVGGTLGGTFGAPNYVSIDATTGRGTGNITLTSGNNSSATNVVIYAVRLAQFMVLDMQSSNPGIELVQ